jgi:hypothetical protein
MRDRVEPATLLGWGYVALSGLVYFLSAHNFDSYRDDFFYLSDAFLQGRTWLERPIGPNDTIHFGGHFYVPFAPFPAIAFMPLVALVGPEVADQHGPTINAVLAAVSIGLCWMLLGRMTVRNLVHRTFLVALFGYSTTLWWVTTRGGVWHTGQFVATFLTLACLVELWGRQRPPLVGLLAGAAFLTRAPLAFAVPFYMLLLEPYPIRDTLASAAGSVRGWLERLPIREWLSLGLGTVPAIAFFFWYNDLRFGDPLESGYQLAVLPPWLELRRQIGLFSLAHVGWNVDLLLFKLPNQIPEFPWFKPDGLGMSVLFTSPALLLAFRAPWRDRRTWILLAGAVAVLIPTLLYYGGGWLQYGYRYFLDSIPFLVAMAGLAVARYGLHWIWWPILAWGLWINAMGVYWVDKI